METTGTREEFSLLANMPTKLQEWRYKTPESHRCNPSIDFPFKESHRISCHRCGNIRKRKIECSNTICPHTFCGRCYDKIFQEFGQISFEKGCPVCKGLCCCSAKSSFCNRKNHCYRKCPSTKNYSRNCNSNVFESLEKNTVFVQSTLNQNQQRKVEIKEVVVVDDEDNDEDTAEEISVQESISNTSRESSSVEENTQPHKKMKTICEPCENSKYFMNEENHLHILEKLPSPVYLLNAFPAEKCVGLYSADHFFTAAATQPKIKSTPEASTRKSTYFNELTSNQLNVDDQAKEQPNKRKRTYDISKLRWIYTADQLSSCRRLYQQQTISFEDPYQVTYPKRHLDLARSLENHSPNCDLHEQDNQESANLSALNLLVMVSSYNYMVEESKDQIAFRPRNYW